MKFNQCVPALVGAGCLALLFSAPIARAQADSMGGGKDASPADKMFVKKAMAGGMAEVELGKLAAEKGNSAEVKQFGQHMVDDHSKMNDQMKPIASQIGVTPPSSIPPAEKALETKLNGLSGAAFDKAYIQAMVKDHRKDLMEFKKEASTGKSSAVKDAATQGVEVISGHLKMAEDLSSKHGGSAMSAGMTGSPQQ